MTSAISKRQQARNERALQDLINNQPGNDRCADCFARNPGWASWSLGIFLCMRCAALHRKLGTHVSKVKSLSMDAWGVEQVEHMKKVGNIASNRRFNPRNVKPNIPIDADEIDSAMERFIRAKYQHQTLIDGKPQVPQKDSPDDDENDRPPLPPKPTPSRFGASLRSSSSTYPTAKSDFDTEPLPARQGNDWKLTTLREMGFTDDKKNAAVLKGVSGDFEKAVEALARLGEGGAEAQIRNAIGAKAPSRPKSPPRPPRFPSPPPQPTANMRAPVQSQPTGAYVTNENQAPGAQLVSPSPPVQSQPQQPHNPYNPFQSQQHSQLQQQPQFQQQQQQPHPPNVQSLENAFHGMNLSTPSPMMPTYTGNFSATSSQGTPSTSTNPFLKTFTPPMSPTPYQNFQQTQQVQYQPTGAQMQGYGNPPQQANPFLRTSRSQNFAVSGSGAYAQPSQTSGSFSSYGQQAPQTSAYGNGQPWLQQDQVFGQQNGFYQEPQQQQQQQQQQHRPTISPGVFTNNPSLYYSPTVQSPAAMDPSPVSGSAFDQSFQNFNQQSQQQQPQQPQQVYQQQQQPAQFFSPQQQHQGVQNQMYSMQQPQQAMGTQQFSYQQPQPMVPQPTGRLDKSSILALYSAPHLAPQRLNTVQEHEVATNESAPKYGELSNGSAQANPRRSVTMPAAGSHNPFASLAQPGASNGHRGLGSHMSQESVDFAGFQGGRQSPDAFRSLSARIV